MRNLTGRVLLWALVSGLIHGAAQAAECESPPRRDPMALRESAQQDEMLALALDKVVQACSAAGTGETCVKSRSACADLARGTVERGSRHEEGVFLADLQRSLNGQRYAFTDPGPASSAPAVDTAATTCLAASISACFAGTRRSSWDTATRPRCSPGSMTRRG